MAMISLRMPDGLVQRIDAVAQAASASQPEGAKVQRTHIVLSAVNRALPFMEATYGIEATPTDGTMNGAGRPRSTLTPKERVPGWLAPHVHRLGVDEDATIARECGKSAGSVRYWRVLLS